MPYSDARRRHRRRRRRRSETLGCRCNVNPRSRLLGALATGVYPTKTMNSSRNIPHVKIVASETMNNSRSPSHELMLEILSRVPARSLVRFRCVCKLWNSLFHDSHFVRQQLKHASKNPTTFLGYSCMFASDQVAFYTFKIIARMVVLGNEFIVPVKGPIYYRMVNACNGLIAIYGESLFGESNAYVANPCTREWMAVPKFTQHEFTRHWMPPGATRESHLGFGLMPPGASRESHLGFGFCTATGKYKLVRISWRDGTVWSCWVLTLGTDRSWRSLGDDAPYPVTEFQPCYANGYIYFTLHAADSAGPQRILSFDVCKEKFAMIQLPRCRPEPYGVYRHLCASVVEGFLCLLDWRVFVDDERLSYLPVMHVHVLKNHEDSVWRDSYILTLRLRSVKCRPRNGFNRAAAANNMFPISIKNGKVLLYRRYQSWRLHDLHTGACPTIHLPGNKLEYIRNRSMPFACAESIVPIDFLKN